MLSAIHNKRVANCDFTQSDIVHIETTVNAVTGLGQPFVFFDRNATFDYSNAYTNLAQLDQVAWDLITETPQLDGYCKFFQDDQTKPRYVDRKAKRMAEFLVKTRVPIGAITRIGVHTQAKRLEVQQIATTYNITTPIIVMPDWYF